MFYLEGTSYADLAPADLPELGPEVLAVCAGTLALATDPPAGAIETLLERESGRRLIVVDPNVRPAVFGDRDDYLRRFERWAAFAHVIKLSDADAEWLYPGLATEALLDAILARGTRLVVLTRGADGALAKTASARGRGRLAGRRGRRHRRRRRRLHRGPAPLALVERPPRRRVGRRPRE